MRKAHYIALGFVGLLTVGLLRWTEAANARLKPALGTVFLPFFGLAASTQRLTDRASATLLPRQTLAAENERLRRENTALRIRLQEAEDAMRENERLRSHLAWVQRSPWKVRLGRVMGRDPANWWRTVQIDLGRKDGLRSDLAVLTADGLVGRVAEVGEIWSRVVLLGDPNCRVAAMALEGRQPVDNGVIAGSASVLDPSMVLLSYLSRSSSVKPGQRVVTSGLGGVFPKGIPIGQLVDSRAVEYGLYTDARIKLFVNLNELEEVWVMLP